MKNRKTYKILLVLLISVNLVTFISCKKSTEKSNKEKSDTKSIDISENTTEETLYRPHFHFTPKANWMNDPNGMFYLDGTYHLYFQYYPEGNVWGPMHWGHATSKDMITWKEQPIALYPDDLGLIFSGSAVVDKNNSSGLGKDGLAPVVAMFTYHNVEEEKAKNIDFQTQAIAYSLDQGMTWTKYDQNPVIKNPGIRDFRDPKVIWDDNSEKWIMALAAANKVMFYSSPNLKEWNLESEFGEGIGQHGGVWECPDLFPLEIEGTNETKWVLIVSINPAAPNGGSGTQYFIGDFDGNTFTLDTDFQNQLQKQNAVWLDYGRDNYAGVTWSNIPNEDGRRLFIGWMSNWQYARDVPTETWRSAMTIPRELKLIKQQDNYILTSTPISELSKYISNSITKDYLKVSKARGIISENEIDLSRFSLEFQINNLTDSKYSFILHNKVGDSISFGLDKLKNNYFVNRKRAGRVDFSDKFANTISKAPINNSSNTLKVRALIDKTSIEIFYNDGETVMTEIFFPNQPFETLSVLSSDENLIIENIKIEELKFN